MSNHDTTHLDEEKLLLFLDGETDPGDASAIADHLAACWSCRARRDGLQATITTSVHANQLLQQHVPPPVGNWPGIGARLDREDASRTARGWLSWRDMVINFQPKFAGIRVVWTAAAVVILVVIAVLILRNQVTAAELLARASAVERIDGHRQFTLEERNPSNQSVIGRHRVDVWQSPTRHIS